MIALIPAKTGSKRIPNKNFKLLGGKPLLNWTVDAALDAGFEPEGIFVCTNDPVAVGDCYPGNVHIIEQPHPLHRDDCCDIEILNDVCEQLDLSRGDELCYLRPTSPFRDAQSIREALDRWETIKHDYDSMRAIRRASECPWKMWRFAEDTYEIDPITSVAAKKHLHSRPTQTLEDAWVQTAGLEVLKVSTILDLGTIAGNRIAGFPLGYPQALDLNTEADWEHAERLLPTLV